MATQLQKALIASGISQLVMASGDEKHNARVEAKLDVVNVSDTSLLVFFRYGLSRRPNDKINAEWHKHKKLVADGKAERVTEREFRLKAMEEFEEIVLTGAWNTPRKSSLTYDVRATRFELSAWLAADGVQDKAIKKIVANDEELWATVTRRKWLNLARGSGMDEDEIKNTDLAAKVAANLEAVKASFADAIEKRAAALKAADQKTTAVTSSTDGMTL